MMREASVMVGCRSQSAARRSGWSGALPYSTMPARTQSSRTCASPPWRSSAALLAMQRSPGRSCVAAWNACTWCAMPRGPSASLKWVMHEISSTWGSAFRRAQALR